MKLNILIAFLLLPLFLSAQEFHVMTNGDDGASGSAAQPWESIQHAMDNATPGSTVYIHEGVYNERVYVNVSGTPGNYITFKAFEEDEVVLDGTGMTDYALLEIYNVHHIAIEGFRVRNNEQVDAVGILIEGACDHIRIEDCDISNINFSTDPNAAVNSSTNAQALIVYGTEANHAITDLEIIDNEIFDCRLGYSEALAVNGNVDGFVISENEVHDVSNIGIDVIGHEGTCDDPDLDQARNGIIADNETFNCLSPYATSAGIYVDGGKDLIIERNKVHGNQWGIEIGAENIGKSTSDIIVRNNFVYNNSTAGIHVGGYDYPSGSGKVTDVILANNTLYGNDTEEDYTGELYLSYNEGLTVKNNIFFANNSKGAMMSDENLSTASIGIEMYDNMWYHPDGDGNIEFTFDGNSYSSLDDFDNATGFGNSSKFDNPKLVSGGSSPNLHLSSTSPAIDFSGASANNAGSTDIDGQLRVASGTIDLGADEFGSPSRVNDLFVAKDLSVFPNPADTEIIISTGNAVLSTMQLYDHLGRVQMRKEWNEGGSKATIDVSGLAPGVYDVVARDSAGEVYRSRVVNFK